MTKITITRVGQEKVINYTNKKTGQPDSFKKVGVQTNEYGERWMDITYRGEVPVKVGQSYDVDITEREYNGKTYYDAALPKTPRQGGMSTEQYQILLAEIRAINTNVLRVLTAVSNPNVTSAGTKVPDFSEVEDRKKEVAQQETPNNSLTDEELASLDELFN